MIDSSGFQVLWMWLLYKCWVCTGWRTRILTELSSGAKKHFQCRGRSGSMPIVCLGVKLMSNLSKQIVDLSINFLKTWVILERRNTLHQVCKCQSKNSNKQKYNKITKWNEIADVGFIFRFRLFNKFSVYVKAGEALWKIILRIIYM